MHKPLVSRLCLHVCCCLQSIVSFQGHFNVMQKFANQPFWSPAHQTGLSSSKMRPMSPLVRFSCHGSSGWQKRCTSDPSSFSRLFLTITSTKKVCQSENVCSVFTKKKYSEELFRGVTLGVFVFSLFSLRILIEKKKKCIFLGGGDIHNILKTVILQFVKRYFN